jgi:hypothetical protein
MIKLKYFVGFPDLPFLCLMAGCQRWFGRTTVSIECPIACIISSIGSIVCVVAPYACAITAIAYAIRSIACTIASIAYAIALIVCAIAPMWITKTL